MEKYSSKRHYKFIVGILIASYWVACSPKQFTKDTSVNACQNFAETCISSGGVDTFDYSVTANGGLVDIVIMDDNSGSMSFEQQHMADKFTSFLAQLDGRSIDYRIGIITSDISSAATENTNDDSPQSALYNPPRAINQNGQLQDGNLVPFSDGSPFITSAMANRSTLFSQNIKRSETLTCETFLRQYPSSQPPSAGMFANCPSGDERGMFAVNLFLSKNPSSFIRPNAHLAVVIVSDEDERSGLYLNPDNTAYTLETNDLVQTALDKVHSTYSGKALSIHSIIVRPGDSSCLYTQSHQLGPNGTEGQTFNYVLGSYGQKYATATQMTSGILGDVCANDYGSQLANIGADIVDHVTDITLACPAPANLAVTLTPAQPSISWSVTDSNLHFSSSLPPGTQAHLTYSCTTL